MTNKMREIKIEKLTLNVGAGRDENRLAKGEILLKKLTNKNPVKTITKKRIATWDLRPGLAVGCKLTIRGKEAEELLKRLLAAKDNILDEKQISSNSFSFGVPEYIDIPGIKYDPDLGILGFEVCISLERAGYRITKRRIKTSKVGPKHIMKKEEVIKYLQDKFSVKVTSREEELRLAE